MSSSDEREEVIWQISGDVDLPSEASEGERFCHAINVSSGRRSRRRTTKS